MAEANIVFVTGGSSGIGRALVEALPLAPATVIDISRRGSEGCEHFAADLSDPSAWKDVAELFRSRLQGFEGERAVFVHSAGTLEPIGPAGEVDTDAYARNVLLNSAAPQVLGHAFLRALRGATAAGSLVLISSGAAQNVYEGWSSYCAGKAAVDQWARTVGAEQARRGDRCRVVAVAPGVVATAMQEQIRATDVGAFPEVARFIALHEEGGLRDPKRVAEEIWDFVLRDPANGTVVDLRSPDA